MPEVACDYCGDTHHRYPSRMDRENYFCDADCRKAFSQKDNHYEPCSNCGSDVKVPPSRRKGEYGDYHIENHFCDKECESEWKQQNWVGENHPNWREFPKNTCEECGEDYPVKPSEKESSRFCSWACKKEDWAEEPETRECANCGAEVTRQPHNFNGERAVCSKQCYREWWSEEQRGSGNPAWKGGKSGITAVRRMIGGQSWDKTAREVRADSGHVCQRCGEFQPNRKLDVHHIIPVASGGTNGDWNLMALCQTCHHEVEKYTKQFTEPHLTKYAPEQGGKQ